MDEAVARIRSRMQPAGVDADYDLAYEHFDLMHFLLQVRPLLSSDDVDPLKRFLGNGPRAKASPEINFSTQAYLSRHPERGKDRNRSPYVEWLRHGKAAGEIADPAPRVEDMASVLELEVADLVATLADTRTSLQQRLRSGTLGEMFAKAAEVEPLIADAWTESARPVVPPFATPNVVDQVVAMHDCQRAAGFGRARLLVVASDPRWGGGRRFEGNLAHALTAQRLEPHDVVVLYTDKGGAAPPGRFPRGVREVDLARHVEGMDREAAHRLLVELIRSFRADAVVNVNSRLLYEAFVPYGKALAASERLFLMMFCNEQQAMGNWVGIPLRFFYRCFDLVEGVLTDSAWLASWLRERHQLGEAESRRVHVVRAPVDPEIPLVESFVGTARPHVFWAGRWDRQKRMDLAFEVARRMPDVDFRMWGESVLTNGPLHEPPGNVTLEGAYAHLSDLDLSQASAWLYTSGWDGVPSQLLEVGMTGVPIVGSLVGGTGEVLDRADAWPVAEVDDPDAYVHALREVLSDPEAARERARALRERLLKERTMEGYAEVLGDLLLSGRNSDRREAP